jgi:hypothetical protein
MNKPYRLHGRIRNGLSAAPGVAKQPPRYTVTPTSHGCMLTLYGDQARDYGRDYQPRDDHGRAYSEHHFAVVGSYVYETTHKPGTSGRQVCETLFGHGSTMHASDATLVDKIRRLARRHCDAYDREWNAQ